MSDDHIFDMDLVRVVEGRRRETWRQWNEDTFRNIQIVDLHGGPLEGYIRGVKLGSGRLIKIYSAGRKIARKPVPEVEPNVSVLLQLTGITNIDHLNQHYVLTPGDIGIIDGSIEFDQFHSLASEFIMLQMQKSLALVRRPMLVVTPIAVHIGEQATALLFRDALQSAFAHGAMLSPTQRESLCQILFDYAAMLSEEQDDGLGHDQKRRREALVAIEECLADRAFGATTLADRVGLSRRRLDEIFVKHVGVPVSSYIWERRLARARDMLRDPRQTGRSITEIAFDVGFEDSSHFSRRFKSKYGLSPKQWRKFESS